MVLTGYTFEGLQYFYTLENFVANGFENLNLKRYLIPVKPAQIEAVKIINDTEFWITSESQKKVWRKFMRKVSKIKSQR